MFFITLKMIYYLFIYLQLATCKSVTELWFSSFECYKERPCLGKKVGDKYEWISFNEVHVLIFSLNTILTIT